MNWTLLKIMVQHTLSAGFDRLSVRGILLYLHVFVHSWVVCLILQAARNYGRRRGKGNHFKTFEIELHQHFPFDYCWTNKNNRMSCLRPSAWCDFGQNNLYKMCACSCGVILISLSCVCVCVMQCFCEFVGGSAGVVFLLSSNPLKTALWISNEGQR